MAVIKQGILGGGSGKVAKVTMTAWKGRAVIKGRPLSVANPKTAGQVSNRSAFKSCVQFASLILASLIVPLMNRFAGNISGYNLFTRLNKNYFDETGLITPLSLNFGTGKLGNINSMTAVASDGTPECVINWDSALDNSYKQNTDKAYAMIVNLDTQEIVFQGDTGATRVAASTTLDTTEILNPTQDYYAYLVFLRADGTLVGNTKVVLVAPAP
jgi:hypothetical protein